MNDFIWDQGSLSWSQQVLNWGAPGRRGATATWECVLLVLRGPAVTARD